MKQSRTAGIRIFYGMHRRYRPGDYETWNYIAPIQKPAGLRKPFEFGTWGGEFRAEFEPQPGEIVAQEGRWNCGCPVSSALSGAESFLDAGSGGSRSAPPPANFQDASGVKVHDTLQTVGLLLEMNKQP